MSNPTKDVSVVGVACVGWVGGGGLWATLYFNTMFPPFYDRPSVLEKMVLYGRRS